MLRAVGIQPVAWFNFAAPVLEYLDATAAQCSIPDVISAGAVRSLRPGSSAMTDAEPVATLAEPVFWSRLAMIMNDLSPGRPDHGLLSGLRVFR